MLLLLLLDNTACWKLQGLALNWGERSCCMVLLSLEAEKKLALKLDKAYLYPICIC